jgi:hypothetical protein
MMNRLSLIVTMQVIESITLYNGLHWGVGILLAIFTLLIPRNHLIYCVKLKHFVLVGLLLKKILICGNFL